jgi:hypothetical protein
MFRNDIKTFSSYDLIEDIKLISSELNSRYTVDEQYSKDLTNLIKDLSDKLLKQVS